MGGGGNYACLPLQLQNLKGHDMYQSHLWALGTAFLGPFFGTFVLASKGLLPYFLIAPFAWRMISQWFVVNIGGVILLVAICAHSPELAYSGLVLLGLALGLLAGSKTSCCRW